MTPEDITPILEAAGFTHRLEGDILPMNIFSLPVADGYEIKAVLFDQYVEVQLEPVRQSLSVGPMYRVRSPDGLKQEIAVIVERLSNLASTPDLLKCPKCQVRHVVAKDGRYGWFVSCTGANSKVRMSQDGMKYRDLACRGTSKAFQPFHEIQ